MCFQKDSRLISKPSHHFLFTCLWLVSFSTLPFQRHVSKSFSFYVINKPNSLTQRWRKMTLPNFRSHYCITASWCHQKICYIYEKKQLVYWIVVTVFVCDMWALVNIGGQYILLANHSNILSFWATLCLMSMGAHLTTSCIYDLVEI